MREVGVEPVSALDRGDDAALLLGREVLAAPAPGARQVDVGRLLGPVVLGAALQVRVGEDPGVLEHREGPVDGGGVHAREDPLHAVHEGGGGDVTFGGEDLPDDDAPLRRHAQPAVAQGPEDVVDGRHGADHSIALQVQRFPVSGRMTRMSGWVSLEVVDAVAAVRLERPPANAISRALAEELLGVVEGIASRSDIGAVVVHGGERMFAAGADIRELAELDPAGARATAGALGAAAVALETLPLVSVAAIEGFALGGGLELALACDLRVASDAAMLGLPEITIGVIPGAGGTQRLPRLVGGARARDLVLTGRRVAADEALAIGLVDRLVPAGAAFHAAMDLGRTFASGPRAALAAAKAALVAARGDERRGFDTELDRFSELFGGADQREGMAAFLEKRPPRFGGSR